jgi:catechol O-methyltransferase
VTPEAVLESIEAVAPERSLPIIGPKRGVFLDEAVEEHHPATILEVGTLVGYSAIRMGRLLKPGQKITCIEVKEEMVQEARSNIMKAGLPDRIEVLHGDAKKVIPTLKGPFDMVYLDAVKEDYLAYLKLSERFLHTGSVVVADNVKAFATEMADYLDYVRNSGRFKSTYREAPSNWGKDEGDAIEVSVKL